MQLVFHHVGGRNGTTGFDLPKQFSADMVTVLYDADAECVEHSGTRALGGKIITLPYCIGAEIAKAQTFHLNYDPYTSSLRKISEDYVGFYLNAGAYDYLCSDVMRPMREVALDVTMIDAALKMHPEIPPPDFLSVDTQGTDFEVLYGARGVIKSSVVAIATEVGLHPMYEGQKLFGDICALLRDLGFDFVRFTHLSDYAPHRGPIGLRGDGYQTVGDALFFRRPDALPLGASAMARKLSFMALVTGQIESALMLAHRGYVDGRQSSQWERMLQEFQLITRDTPQTYPPLFSDAMSFEQSQNRFRIGAPPRKEQWGGAAHSAIKGRLQRWPFLLKVVRTLRLPHLLQRARNLVSTWQTRRRLKAEAKRQRADTPLQILLRTYGLDAAADVCRRP